jgi:DNA-binding NtrC family response regulator
MVKMSMNVPSEGARDARILFVDDDPQVLSAFKRVVRAAGWTVDVAGDAATALELAKQHSYGIILADQQMPDMSGAELITKLRSKQPQARYIVVTAHSELAVAASKTPGFFVVISKPWDTETLLTILSACQRQARAAGLH